ncbi:MAG: hypothetical protein RL486_1163 [Actinomycetota bacterium]
MPSPRPRPRAVLVVIALVVLAVAGAGLWMVLDRPETRSAEKLCAQLGAVTSLSSSLVTLDPTTLGPQVAELQRAAAVAPSDIQAQLAVLASFVEEIADTVRASPVDKKETLVAALAERQDRVDEVTASGQAVEAWAITNCGVPLRTTTTQISSTTSRR